MRLYHAAIFGIVLLIALPAFAQFKPDPYPDDGPRQRQEWKLEQMLSTCDDNRDWRPPTNTWTPALNGPPYSPGWENCAVVKRVLLGMWTEDTNAAQRQSQQATEKMRQAIEAFKP